MPPTTNLVRACRDNRLTRSDIRAMVAALHSTRVVAAGPAEDEIVEIVEPRAGFLGTAAALARTFLATLH